MTDYIAPDLGKTGFHCPYSDCRAFAHQVFNNKMSGVGGAQPRELPGDFRVGFCGRCARPHLWVSSRLVWPPALNAPAASQDLPEQCKRDFEEAREIVDASPRGAAALLRLIVQKICTELLGRETGIDRGIADLVKLGMPITIQQALDVLRVVGNNAVHPGEMDLADDKTIALKLFSLVNLIVQDRITTPNEVQALFDGLPEGAKAAIERRDAGSQPDDK